MRDILKEYRSFLWSLWVVISTLKRNLCPHELKILPDAAVS